MSYVYSNYDLDGVIEHIDSFGTGDGVVDVGALELLRRGKRLAEAMREYWEDPRTRTERVMREALVEFDGGPTLKPLGMEE